MKKIFCLSAILAVYVVSANGDSKCQNLARIVGGMPSVELRQYNCTPAASNNGTHQFITFTTTSIDPPSNVCNTIVQYMANSVGDATYSCSNNGDIVTVLYTGNYDSALPMPSSVGLLAIVLGMFPNPTLGGINCTLGDSFVTDSSYAYIRLEVPSTSTNYQQSCNSVYSYLRTTQLLTANTTNTCYYKSGSPFSLLEIWGTDCQTSAQMTQ